MLEKKTRIESLIKQYPEIEKLVLEKKQDSPEIDKIDYFFASVISLAETEPNLCNSYLIKKIEKLWIKSPMFYPSNAHTILAIVKGLLDTLDSTVTSK